jgi:hypothetical protein
VLHPRQNEQHGTGAYLPVPFFRVEDPFTAGNIHQLKLLKNPAFCHGSKKRGVFVFSRRIDRMGRNFTASGGSTDHPHFFVLFAVGKVMEKRLPEFVPVSHGVLYRVFSIKTIEMSIYSGAPKSASWKFTKPFQSGRTRKA